MHRIFFLLAYVLILISIVKNTVNNEVNCRIVDLKINLDISLFNWFLLIFTMIDYIMIDWF
jgi:hypothetical protein